MVFSINTKNDMFTIFLSGKSCLLYSNKSKLLDYLMLENDNNFLHTFSLGIAIKSIYRISYNFYYRDKFEKIDIPATISLSIIPN